MDTVRHRGTDRTRGAETRWRSHAPAPPAPRRASCGGSFGTAAAWRRTAAACSCPLGPPAAARPRTRAATNTRRSSRVVPSGGGGEGGKRKPLHARRRPRLWPGRVPPAAKQGPPPEVRAGPDPALLPRATLPRGEPRPGCAAFSLRCAASLGRRALFSGCRSAALTRARVLCRCRRACGRRSREGGAPRGRVRCAEMADLPPDDEQLPPPPPGPPPPGADGQAAPPAEGGRKRKSRWAPADEVRRRCELRAHPPLQHCALPRRAAAQPARAHRAAARAADARSRASRGACAGVASPAAAFCARSRGDLGFGAAAAALGRRGRASPPRFTAR